MRAAGRLLALAVAAAGCATQGDVARENSELRRMILETQKRTEQLQRAVENLQRQVEDPRGRGGSDRMAALEKRMADLEDETGRGHSVAVSPDGEGTPAAAPSAPTATTPPPPPPAAQTTDGSDDWARDVAREQSAVAGTNLREKGEFLAIVDVLAKRDCTRAIPQLNAFAAANKESPLGDDALYWAARCYQLKGDQKQAISKFYDVVTRFPKGDKAPAALWAQGNLFIAIGDTPDARLALGKLIREHPNSDEAVRARQRLAELER